MTDGSDHGALHRIRSSFERLARTRIVAILTSRPVIFTLAIAAAGLIVNEAIRRPLWMDEVFSIRFARVPPLQTLALLYEGYDTQAPLYYVYLSLVTSIIGGESVLLLRLSSLLPVFVAVPFLLRLLDRWGMGELAPLTVFLLAINGTITHFLAVELRVYSWMFLLAVLVLHARDHWLTGGSRTATVYFTAMMSLLLLAHYYALYYVGALAVVDVLRRGAVPRLRRAIPYACAAGVFALWMPGLLAQWDMYHAPNYMRPWNAGNFVFWLHTQLRILAIPVLLSAAIVVWIRVRTPERLAGLRGTGTLVALVLVPVATTILTHWGVAMTAERYLIPSLLALILLAVRALLLLPHASRRVAIALCVAVATVLAVHRVRQYHELQRRDWAVIAARQELAAAHPLVCEDANEFLITSMNRATDARYDIRYPLDRETTAASPDAKLHLFTHEIMRMLGTRFAVPGILEWDTLAARLPVMYVLDGKMNRILERRVLQSGTYEVEWIDSTLVRAVRKPHGIPVAGSVPGEAE